PMRITTILIFLITLSVCRAQNFSGKTNDIVLNTKKPASTVKTDLPMITWISPRQEYTNSQNPTVEVEATVHTTVRLKSLRVAIGDGVATRGEKPLEITEGQTIKIKQTLRLMDGQNLVRIIAENTDGGIVTSSRSVLVGKDAIADAVAIDRKDYILLFDTHQYDHWTDLVNPIDDATSIAREVKEQYRCER